MLEKKAIRMAQQGRNMYMKAPDFKLAVPFEPYSNAWKAARSLRGSNLGYQRESFPLEPQPTY